MAGSAVTPATQRLARLARHLLSPLAAAGADGAEGSLYFPADGDGPWEEVDCEAEGWAVDGLAEVCRVAEQAGSTGLMITHRGRIVLERYWGSSTHTDVSDVNSVQKSIVALLLGIAWDRRLFSLSDPVAKHVPAWTRGAAEREEARITVEHLLTMTTGLDAELGGQQGPGGGGVTRAQPAGQRWRYNTVAYQTGTHCLLTALAGTTLQRLTRDWLLRPLGCSVSEWRVRTWLRGRLVRNGDSRLLPHMTGFFSCPRELTRIGILLLSSGRWRGRQIVSKAWIDALSRSCALNPAYGYLWWLNGRGSAVYIGGDSAEPAATPGGMLPHAPKDVLMAHGFGGQQLYVSRQTGLVVVLMGRAEGPISSPPVSSTDDELWKRIIAASPDELRRAAGVAGRS